MIPCIHYPEEGRVRQRNVFFGHETHRIKHHLDNRRNRLGLVRGAMVLYEQG